MKQKRRLNSLNDIFIVGKYKHNSILMVIYNNPQYIDWCIEKKIIVPSQDIKDELRKSKFLSQ